MTTNKSIDFRLYLITDRRIFAEAKNSLLVTRHLLEAVEEALKAGVRAVQLREKDLPVRETLDVAYRMKKLTSKYKTLLFINDRVDIALCVGADGVHLGQSGIPVHAVRNVVGDRLLVGASTHSLEEALAAEKEGADFMTFGPIYSTPSKLRYGKPLGTESLRKIRDEVSIPIFGIGGIEANNAKSVTNAGADGVALIRGILGGTDIEGAAKKYLEILGGC